ncbi:PRELI-like family-domain-containing protein [Dimargaris cristalligena]|uniref:PRELI-like family-domain-containing protein n=1 Tax=Dimargaris cristalligena TaxID=215637 RepID=A0A4Q0A287_9FUNG|nr:PRELI-like family-domain-containing protein [Dimargaris cristalligena]|eukprot:RKP39611.1 PRELI-like family-domain-containing protein [Dimargaris cristalligena]
MVKFYQQTHDYEHPWSRVTVAFWLRYPNPFAAHVLSTDVIDRHVDPNGVLHTTRLILKRGNVPRWARSFMKHNEAFILEQSHIDPATRTMVSVSKNISHKRAMVIEETQTYTVAPTDPNHRTRVKYEVRFLSNLGWGLTSKIESFSQKRFADSSSKSRLGMAYILEKLQEKSKLPGYLFKPPQAA